MRHLQHSQSQQRHPPETFITLPAGTLCSEAPLARRALAGLVFITKKKRIKNTFLVTYSFGVSLLWCITPSVYDSPGLSLLWFVTPLVYHSLGLSLVCQGEMQLRGHPVVRLLGLLCHVFSIDVRVLFVCVYPTCDSIGSYICVCGRAAGGEVPVEQHPQVRCERHFGEGIHLLNGRADANMKPCGADAGPMDEKLSCRGPNCIHRTKPAYNDDATCSWMCNRSSRGIHKSLSLRTSDASSELCSLITRTYCT